MPGQSLCGPRKGGAPSPRISCKAWWGERTSCGFPYRKPHTRLWLEPRSRKAGVLRVFCEGWDPRQRPFRFVVSHPCRKKPARMGHPRIGCTFCLGTSSASSPSLCIVVRNARYAVSMTRCSPSEVSRHLAGAHTCLAWVLLCTERPSTSCPAVLQSLQIARIHIQLLR